MLKLKNTNKKAPISVIYPHIEDAYRISKKLADKAEKDLGIDSKQCMDIFSVNAILNAVKDYLDDVIKEPDIPEMLQAKKDYEDELFREGVLDE